MTTAEKTKASVILELAERVEKATEADRWLDEQIALALGHKTSTATANYTMEMVLVIEWQAPHPFAGMKEPCPRWTESLEAAVSLVPSGVEWLVSRNKDGTFRGECEYYAVDANDAARALTAATLIYIGEEIENDR